MTAAWLLGHLGGLWSWALGSFAATFLYFVVVGVEMGFEDAEERRRKRAQHGGETKSPA